MACACRRFDSCGVGGSALDRGLLRRLAPSPASTCGGMSVVMVGEMNDPRPICRYCSRRWLPPAGVDANKSFCRRCAPERRAHAEAAIKASGRVPVQIGGYVLWVPK